ncbi:hypothetical protein NKH18_45290 [Streptomyces sp. M10(2022)]
MRLSESVTGDVKARRAPTTMQLGPESDYRLVITEGFGPVGEIRDWAIKRIGAPLVPRPTASWTGSSPPTASPEWPRGCRSPRWRASRWSRTTRRSRRWACS